MPRKLNLALPPLLEGSPPPPVPTHVSSLSTPSKKETKFLTRSPKTSPPDKQGRGAAAPAEAPALSSEGSAEEEKTRVLKRAHLQLSRVNEKYKLIFEEFTIDTITEQAEIAEATMSLTQLIDRAVRGNAPTGEDMNEWGERATGFDPSLFPSMIANAATHLETLPMRVMDFVRCDYKAVGECVDRIVREANRHERRVRLEIQKVANGFDSPSMKISQKKMVEAEVDVPAMELSPSKEKEAEVRELSAFEKTLLKTYVSEDLLRIAASKWKIEDVPPPPPEGGLTMRKREDGKSEACSVS